jgi:FkbM family methyltransferase
MLTTHLRRLARGVQHDLWPTPEHAVLQELEHRATHDARRTSGRIAIAPYEFEYADAMTAWPQWDEIFVRYSLAFETAIPQPRILDCGANIGLASLYFKRQFPNARITAFEADPALAAVCRRNLASNGVDDVEVRDTAIWTSAGTVEFVCEGSDSGAIAALKPSVTGANTEVPAERLYDWLNESVDLLKLDIEGAEAPVLSDCRDRLHNVRAMTIDLHEFNATCRQTGTLFDLLAGAGFTFDMRDLVPLPWRGARRDSPFANASPVWVATVRAWRS